MDKRKVMIILCLIISISFILGKIVYKAVKDYAYNKTISDYLEQKQQN